VTASSIDPSPSDLVSVEISGDGPAVRIIAVGEVDSTSAPVLRQHLDTLLDGDVREVTVDLVQVTFLDSAGLCVLAAAHRRAARQDVALRVLAASRAVIRPLQITGLWDLLKVERVAEGSRMSAQQGVA
jgi:anti-sigma B factor antagonist